MTQTQLAERAGLPQPALSRLESGGPMMTSWARSRAPVPSRSPPSPSSPHWDDPARVCSVFGHDRTPNTWLH
ncbi:helix-turn-helix domain-containing protein [Actinomadura geliboluensis]